jgi:SEC-C motif-containing protein
MPDRQPCPCGSGHPFSACCGPYLDGTALPETAEALMRSRYTAYTLGDAAYLTATWHPTTRRKDLGLGEPVKWIGLEVLRCEAGGPGDTRGQVEFIARYKLRGRAQRLHEVSRFQRRQGRWYYLDGTLNTGTAPGHQDDGD